MMLLPIAYFVIFSYVPMYGVTLAFRQFDYGKGILRSPWVGLKWFNQVFADPYILKVTRNTVLLRLYSMAAGFPAPIILALLLNEVRNAKFKRFVQTCSYLPHFISLVVVCGMIFMFVGSKGPISAIITWFGGRPRNWLMEPQWFSTIYVLSGIWQGTGWATIIYLAALSGVNVELYEAAAIDGANRWQRMRHITFPSILPTIALILILSMGSILAVDFQKVLLLYSPATYETADVLSTYVYRRGIGSADYSFATAVGLLTSLVGLVFVTTANAISKRLGEVSLW